MSASPLALRDMSTAQWQGWQVDHVALGLKVFDPALQRLDLLLIVATQAMFRCLQGDRHSLADLDVA
jgi:hypothetical protein